MTVFEQIGQKLKAARESRGLTLGQIYDKTKISTANLQAIEQGDTDQLPEAVYVTGFIKRYAETVGLNGQNLIEEYKQALSDEGGNHDKGVFGNWGAKNKSVAVQAQPIVQPKLAKAKIGPPKPTFAKTIFYPSIILIMVIALIVLLFDWQQNQYKSKIDPSIASLDTSKYSLPSTTGSDTEKESTDSKSKEDTKTEKSEEGSKVSISASKHVWVNVNAVSTGNSLFTGTMEAGDRRDFQDSQGIKIRAGNGGNLNVSFRGKNETFGDQGKPLTRSFLASNPAGETSTASPDTVSDSQSQAASAVKPKKVVKKVEKPKPKREPSVIQRSPSRYIPGESLGGKRSIVVPYRYTE